MTRRPPDEIDPEDLDDEGPLDEVTAAVAAETASAVVSGSLAEVIEALAAASPGVERQVNGATIFSVRGKPIARLDGDWASFRLLPEVVHAALRTDGTRTGSLGPEWIAFRPARFDRYALDRATSWFELAVRLGHERR